MSNEFLNYLVSIFRGRPKKEEVEKEEVKAKEEVKEVVKEVKPLKKVDEIRPQAFCKMCQGNMSQNKLGQVGGRGGDYGKEDVSQAESQPYIKPPVSWAGCQKDRLGPSPSVMPIRQHMSVSWVESTFPPGILQP